MSRWASIAATIPLVIVLLGVGQSAAVAVPKAVPNAVPSVPSPGYWLVTSTGATYAYNAPYLADVATNRVGDPLDNIARSDCGNGPETPIPSVATCVGISADGDGHGYWIGQSSYFLQSGFSQYAVDGIPQGSAGGECNEAESAGAYQSDPLTGIAAAPYGAWLATADGGVFAICGAAFFGSMGGARLNAPITGMAATPNGNGYWEVAVDGGVFAFGNATFYGSMGSKPLNKPIVGLAATPDGKGYWLVASDGGVFAFGDAGFHGSMGGKGLNAPMTGIAANPDGTGYWTVAGDGGVFAFGDAPSKGSATGQILDTSVVGIAAKG